jgi:pilus assembly protein CpaB
MSSYRIRSLALALLIAGAAAALIAVYISSYRSHVETGANLVQVYVAARDIPEGTLGTDVRLRSEQIPRRNVVAGAIAKPKEIANQITGQPIVSGEQITTRQFRPPAEQGVLARISGRVRAMVVPGDGNQLLAGTLEAGHRVDVLANLKFKVTPASGAGGDRSRVATRLILTNVPVLRAPEQGEGVGQSYSVMLALTGAQAQKLFFAMKNGDWWLILRPVAKPKDARRSVETIESELGDGLSVRDAYRLTGGGNINGNG